MPVTFVSEGLFVVWFTFSVGGVMFLPAVDGGDLRSGESLRLRTAVDGRKVGRGREWRQE